MKIFIFIEWALFHSQSLCYVINKYIYIYMTSMRQRVCVRIVARGGDRHC